MGDELDAWALFRAAVAGGIASVLAIIPAVGQNFDTGPYADEGAYLSALNTAKISVGGANSVGAVRAVELRISDQVDGGCWTNSSAVSARVRAELEGAGIAVYQEALAFRTLFSPLVEIRGLGYRTNTGACLASISMEMMYWGQVQLGDLSYSGAVFSVENPVLLWTASSVISNGGRLDDQFLDQAQEWVDTLVADIFKARRTEGIKAILQTWPSPTPMTQVDFEAFLKELEN